MLRYPMPVGKDGQMKKFTLIGFLILFLAQHQAFARQELNGTMLLKRLQEVNEHIRDTRIELGETLIKHLQYQGDPVQTESMKNIYRIASEYKNFCDCEQRVLFMYSHINDKVRVYISAYLRDLLRKKKKDLDESMKNFRKYYTNLKDKDIIRTVTRLQSRIEEAQDLINQLINFYSSENAKHRIEKEKM